MKSSCNYVGVTFIPESDEEDEIKTSVAFKLSHSQQAALSYITHNIATEKIILLEGSAGTGKTTLTKFLVDYFIEVRDFNVCAIAPTHKAKRVIENVLNENTILPITAFTIASALSSVKEHSFVGTKIYDNKNVKKLTQYQLILVDEVSMIGEADMRLLIDFVRTSNKFMILIGDRNQIPCPSAKYIEIGVGKSKYVEKADSFVFSDPSIANVQLTETIRQAADNPIIQVANYIRDHLLIDFQISQLPNIDSMLIPYSDIYSTFASHWIEGDPLSIRIIAYTNAAVQTHNQELRNYMGYLECFRVGEVLMGYNSLGFPELIIENGQDYIIQSVTSTGTFAIQGYSGLNGHLIHLRVVGTSIVTKQLFFIHSKHSSNAAFLNYLISLAEIVNTNGSTKNDYRNYMAVKNMVIFFEDMYKFNGKVYTETTFKETHPLLFSSISAAVDVPNRTILSNPLVDKLTTMYSHIVEARLEDNKIIGDSEMFADQYKVIEKDIYYGYAITAHKSQGSTFQHVIGDEGDFQKLFNRWNFSKNCLESRIKEKNQLRYVMCTRPKQRLFIAMGNELN